ncbi:hypothetical protein JOF29_003939 [Kribbella aluminosa]|uniref:ESAT-6 protein secretion system EspG family protein n=1 Tax=Kribbella aluminosa TaxID=416017 RepID=A0ABS4UMQ3_9ACTN|nr:hypothetical protein [Kribbella aluminosa]MBP2352856.1 hypothetical protein [Kribbella aluminosa]
MDLRAMYSALPGATALGAMTDAWHWSNAPGLDSSAALSGEQAFQAFALDSYDERLAVALLTFCREHSDQLLRDLPLVVAEGFSHPGYGFSLVVAMSPEVHRLYPDEPEVNAAVRAVVPAYRCEFAGDEDLRDADYRHNRAAGVQGTRWDRIEPRPYFKVRYRGDNGHLAAHRGFARPELIISRVTRDARRDDQFIEFENYRHEVYTVTWKDAWMLTGPDGVPTPYADPAALIAVVNSIIGI